MENRFDEMLKEQKKIRNQKLLYVAMFIVGMMAVMCSCNKEEIKPQSRFNSKFQCNEKSGSVIFKVSNGEERYGWCKEGSNYVEFNSVAGDTIDLITASSSPKELNSFLFIDGVQVQTEFLTDKSKRYIVK